MAEEKQMEKLKRERAELLKATMKEDPTVQLSSAEQVGLCLQFKTLILNTLMTSGSGEACEDSQRQAEAQETIAEEAEKDQQTEGAGGAGAEGAGSEPGFLHPSHASLPGKKIAVNGNVNGHVNDNGPFFRHPLVMPTASPRRRIRCRHPVKSSGTIWVVEPQSVPQAIPSSTPLTTWTRSTRLPTSKIMSIENCQCQCMGMSETLNCWQPFGICMPMHLK